MAEKTEKRLLDNPLAVEQEAKATESAAKKIQGVLSKAAENIREGLEGIPNEYKEEDVQWFVDVGLKQAERLERAVETIDAKAKDDAKRLRAYGASMQPL